MGPMEPGTPSFNLTDSVQVGHNTVGPSTGDIVIHSGNNAERCSMCKTPIDAYTNPGLYCFKDGCNMLFCTNCESFFRTERRPGEKPYCAEHIAEFVGASIPPPPPGIQASTASIPPQAKQQPTAVFVGQTNQSYGGVPGTSNQATAGYVQSTLNRHSSPQNNPYLNQEMVDPLTALRRTLKSWNGEGRCQRSEYWLGFIQYYFIIVVGIITLSLPIAVLDLSLEILMSFFAIFGLIFLIATIPLISQQIRRLHDIGLSGWWFLLIFLPYLGPFALFVMSMLPSEPHPNRFG